MSRRYFCGAETAPLDQYKRCAPEDTIVFAEHQSILRYEISVIRLLLSRGTASAQEVEIRCPRLTETSNGA